jgi:hypothetical protein
MINHRAQYVTPLDDDRFAGRDDSAVARVTAHRLARQQ